MSKLKRLNRQVPKIGAKAEDKKDEVLFSFKEIEPFSYTQAKNDSKFFIDFIERLKKLSELGWQTIAKSDRHSFGFELLPIGQIKKQVDGVEKLIVFRATGNNHVFAGFREDNVFHILFIEYNFGDLYDH